MQVSVFRTEQMVPMHIELYILCGGPASISIAETATDAVIGPPLVDLDESQLRQPTLWRRPTYLPTQTVASQEIKCVLQ